MGHSYYKFSLSLLQSYRNWKKINDSSQGRVITRKPNLSTLTSLFLNENGLEYANATQKELVENQRLHETEVDFYKTWHGYFNYFFMKMSTPNFFSSQARVSVFSFLNLMCPKLNLPSLNTVQRKLQNLTSALKHNNTWYNSHS